MGTCCPHLGPGNLCCLFHQIRIKRGGHLNILWKSCSAFSHKSRKALFMKKSWYAEASVVNQIVLNFIGSPRCFFWTHITCTSEAGNLSDTVAQKFFTLLA